MGHPRQKADSFRRPQNRRGIGAETANPAFQERRRLRHSKYIDKDPTQITFNECNYIYEIQNGEKSAKKIETFGKDKNIGEYLGLQKFSGNDFNVFIDNIEIMRPIKIMEEVKSGAKFKDVMLFYGKFEPDLSKVSL